jgi:hypothetical protein
MRCQVSWYDLSLIAIQALPSQEVQTMLVQKLSFHFDCIKHVTFMCYNLLNCPVCNNPWMIINIAFLWCFIRSVSHVYFSLNDAGEVPVIFIKKKEYNCTTQTQYTQNPCTLGLLLHVRRTWEKEMANIKNTGPRRGFERWKIQLNTKRFPPPSAQLRPH